MISILKIYYNEVNNRSIRFWNLKQSGIAEDTFLNFGEHLRLNFDKRMFLPEYILKGVVEC